MMHNTLALLMVISGLWLATPAAHAEIDGHGPDAWAVTGVAPNDVLNMRMGPGTEYPVIDHLAPDARGLTQVTCVPLLIQPYYSALTQAQRAALPTSWCLMRSSDLGKAGWVATRFLIEDRLQEVAQHTPASASETSVQTIGDPLIDEAAYLVLALYQAFEAASTHANNPFMPPEAEKYFFIGMVADLHGHGADVLYDAQDFQGAVTQIAPDPERPMFRGMISINVDFTNFGYEKRAVFHLRADTGQPGSPVRIFRIEHDGWSFPEF